MFLTSSIASCSSIVGCLGIFRTQSDRSAIVGQTISKTELEPDSRFQRGWTDGKADCRAGRMDQRALRSGVLFEPEPTVVVAEIPSRWEQIQV